MPIQHTPKPNKGSLKAEAGYPTFQAVVVLMVCSVEIQTLKQNPTHAKEAYQKQNT